MTSIIKTEVLRAAVVSAFDRGRYSVRFETQPTGADLAVVPSSITLDLGERDDDLFEDFSDELAKREGLEPRTVHFGYTMAPGLAEKIARRNLEEALGLGADLLGAEAVAEAMEAFVSDDHGAAIPAPGTYERDGLKVYEFALQDAVYIQGGKLSDIIMAHAPDLQAAAHADWVHVYDRTTRERRTLKRPAADAVLDGLADVAADLREKPMFQPRMPEDAFAAVLHGREDREALPGHWRIFRDGDRVIYEPFSEPTKPRSIGEKLTVTDAEGVRGPGEVVELLGSAFRVEVQFPHTDSSGDKADSYRWFFKNNETECYGLKLDFTPFSEPVESPAPVLPNPGALKSAGALMAGDVLRHLTPDFLQFFTAGDLVRVDGIRKDMVDFRDCEGDDRSVTFDRFAFVGRPDADGWMIPDGVNNPAPDCRVKIETASKGEFDGISEQMCWNIPEGSGYRIVKWTLVDMPPLKGDA